MPGAPSTRPSIKVLYDTPYRGGTQRWSTRLHFSGNLNPSNAEFEALYQNLDNYLPYLVSSRSSLKGFVAYHPGSEVPVHTFDETVTGLLTTAATDRVCPGDCAALIRYSTAARTTKNHPIYLFNYFHDVWHKENQADNVCDEWKSVAALFAAHLTNGGWTDGSNELYRSGPYGATANGYYIEPLVTHRDFPR